MSGWRFKCDVLLVFLAALVTLGIQAEEEGVGDPQLMTDHPLYKGELSCSTFERLFATQAQLYLRTTNRSVSSDEDKALASWYWRNLHYFHCTLTPEPEILGKGKNDINRDYWSGLFSYGHAICGSNHGQYTAEMEYLLGHCRGRVVGVDGHNSFEVWLSGMPYGSDGKGKWVLLDSDIATVCFDKEQKALMNVEELTKADRPALLTNRAAKDNRGWLPELCPGDGVGTYTKFSTYEPLSGYAGVPPVIHLRPGETLRRYPRPGLGVGPGGPLLYWGTSPDGFEGPNRHTSYLSIPEMCFNAAKRPEGTNDPNKRARFGNAVFSYRPNFKDGSYKIAVAAEDDQSVTLQHVSPFVIATKPVSKKCEAPGGTMGLVLNGKASCQVCISTDAMKTFSAPVDFKDGLDLTDLVKGHYEYWIKLMAPANALADKDLLITTRCMASGYVMPHLKADGSQITFNAGGQGAETVGPQADTIRKHLVDGALEKPSFTVRLKSPHGERIKSVYWAVRANTGCPPKPELAFKAEYSVDGKVWKILRDDWHVNPPAPYDPPDTWSQSFFFGNKEIVGDNTNDIQVRISNNANKSSMMAQFSLLYDVKSSSRTKVTFCWDEGGQEKQEEHVYPAAANMDDSWKIATGKEPRVKWIEETPVP